MAKAKPKKQDLVLYQTCKYEKNDEYLQTWTPNGVLGRKEYAATAVHIYISLYRGYCADYYTDADFALIVKLMGDMGYRLKDTSNAGVKRFILNTRKKKFLPPVLNARMSREGRLVAAKVKPPETTS
jgi:hypothetical protein